MMITNDGIAFKQGFGEYLSRWYAGFAPNTEASLSFRERGFQSSCKWATGRMIDDAKAMLESYRRNENSQTVNASSLLPVVLAAMARDYTPTTGDWNGVQAPEHYVRLVDEPDASVYKYSQTAHDVRVQLAVFATEEGAARNIAGDLCWFIGQPENRRFNQKFTWGEYTVETVALLESPDVIAQQSDTEQKNLVILTVDLLFKVTVPRLKAPALEDQKDGTGRNPEGYKLTAEVNIASNRLVCARNIIVDDTGIEMLPNDC